MDTQTHTASILLSQTLTRVVIMDNYGYRLGTLSPTSYDLNFSFRTHEPVLIRCDIINTLTIWGREWGGVVLPTFTEAWKWWIVNKDHLQSIKIQLLYYQVHAMHMLLVRIRSAAFTSWHGLEPEPDMLTILSYTLLSKSLELWTHCISETFPLHSMY